jgi:hypothetical protein
VSFFYASALSGGFLEEWKLLGFPKIGDPAVKIIEIGYFQGKSGNIYRDNAGKWEQVSKVTVSEEEIFIPSSSCRTLAFLPLLNKNIVDSKSACVAWGVGIEKVVYAIDNGGRVYSWSHSVGEFGGIEKIFFPLGGTIGSCIFGVVIILAVSLSNYVKGKRRKSNLTE